jgi:hypothetical protein
VPLGPVDVRIESPPIRLALHILGRPGGSGPLLLTLTVPRATPVTLQMFDVLGRGIDEPDVVEVAAGTSTIEWNPDRTSGRDASSGVYWVRADALGQTARTRVVIAR